MAASQQDALDDRRFLFVTGKGGVGKTTVATALAVALASRGKRVLLAMTGVQERVSSLLGSAPIEHDIVQAAPNVWVTKIRAERAMEEYGELVLKVRALARAVFDNKYTSGFFRAVPGLYDWALLGKAWYHTTEIRKDGSWLYDVVLFDAPSTGHGLDMLRVPKVLVELAPPGVLRRDAEAAWSLFRDPERAGVVVVTLAEAMPATETRELMTTLTDELSLPVVRLIINAMHASLFSVEERRALLADEELERIARQAVTAHGAVGWLANASRRAAREQLQHEQTEFLRRSYAGPIIELPYLLADAGTPHGVRALAAHL